jgi:nucleotide-binding universal stress UspA family protein
MEQPRGADQAPARTDAVWAGDMSVLVPLDGSEEAERALAPARRLAAAFGGAVHVVSNTRPDDRWWYARYVDQLRERVADTTTHLADELDPAEGVVATARSLDPCIVCVATHGRSRGAGIVGSTFVAIARAGAAPLVAVGPRVGAAAGADAPGHLLVCLDGSPSSEQALPLAAAWARRLGWPITTVTAADPVLVELDVEAYLEEVARRPELAGMTVGARVLWGMEYPYEMITRCAEREPNALLVATTHARTGLARVAFGSEVARMIHHSPVPVLVQPVRAP